MTKVSLIDTTMRDGHQCLWATRMSTPMMLPILERMDRAGFEYLELFGAVQFDSCIRYLRENPWDRLRLFKERITRTRRQAIIRSRCALGFGPTADDMCEKFVELLVAGGIQRIICFDGMHDLGNIEQSLRKAKEMGARNCGWLIFSESPVHTDEYYVAKAREFIDRCEVDDLMIEDTSGILTPKRISTLVPALREEIGDMRLGLHTHNLIGLGQTAYLEAVEQGIDQLFTCVWPIADSNAPPSVHTTVKNLRRAGAEVEVDLDALSEVSAYLEALADYEEKPKGRVEEYNHQNFDHQIPGGVLSNLASQLKDAGFPEKLDEVLEECGRIREELGWPIMVTPFSQLVSVQATLNVISGERYQSVPDEVKQYALGYFGELMAPIHGDVLDRIMENGSPDITEPPEVREPVLPDLRRRFPGVDDEELLLRAFFPLDLVDEALGAEPNGFDYSRLEKPLIRLIQEVVDRPKLKHVVVSKDNMKAELRR